PQHAKQKKERSRAEDHYFSTERNLEPKRPYNCNQGDVEQSNQEEWHRLAQYEFERPNGRDHDLFQRPNFALAHNGKSRQGSNQDQCEAAYDPRNKEP